jgi:hypothetical protein
MSRPAQTDPGRVRCLGSEREHYFNSPDRTRVRICNRCKARIDAARVSPRATEVRVKTEG